MKWKTIKIGDCCTKIGSGSTPKGGSSVYKEDGVSFIRSQNVHNLEFDYDGLAHIDEKTAKKLNNVSIEENDVLLNITGDSVARTCVVPRNILPARVNQHVSIIRTKRQVINPHYLNFYLASPSMQSYMLGLAFGKGSSRNALTKQIIENFEISCPPIKIQESIASILSHYDDLIEINKRRIALLEESARELYKEWFVRMRFPGWKNIDEKDLPANWKVLRIDDIYETGSGGTPKTGNKIYYNGNINWLRTGELDDSFIFETEIKISEDGLENSSAKMYHRHDVVIAMYGATIGKLGILTGNTSVNQACCVLTPKNSFYDYAFIYLSLIEYRHELIHQRMGAAQQNISQETIRKFKLKFPPLEIMAAFNQKAHPIFDAIEVILRENQILSLQRDRLLPRLMSGQLEV